MCGIAGLFIKDPLLEPDLGALLGEMTGRLASRGPDSAGFALYSDCDPGFAKLTLRGGEDYDFDALAGDLTSICAEAIELRVRHTHAIAYVPAHALPRVRAWLEEHASDVTVMGEGRRLELFKEIGHPEDVARAFGLSEIAGSHGIAHTRMATESAVTTDGAHPFSTGADQCLVHNGSFSNHASLRRELRRRGVTIKSENDTEVAAAHLTLQMRNGATLESGLQSVLDDLDGFFTLVVGTEHGFGVLRDPIACKPAVMAETDKYVAFASEYRSLACLPDIERATVWEPKPATIYFWDRR